MYTLLLGTFFCFFLITLVGGILISGKANAADSVTYSLADDDDESLSGARKAMLWVKRQLALVAKLERFFPKTKSDLSLAQERMRRIGFRNESASSYFFGAKVAGVLVLAGVALLTSLPSGHPVLGLVVAVLIGYGVPEMWLSMRLSRRRKDIRRGLPDFLDLLIVCMEAGLSLDQATVRTVEEMTKEKAPIADEVGLVILEQRAGIARMEAWRHFAERTNESIVRRVVAMLIQSDQFGTSIAKTLRVHSEGMRTERVQRIQEVTAKMSVKMLFPLVMLIFPAIFVVTIGPALILAFDAFKNNLGH